MVDLTLKEMVTPASEIVKEPPKKHTSSKSKSPSTKKKRKYTRKVPDGIKYRCTCCGSVYDFQDGNFWKASTSPLFEGNGGYIHICASCIKRLYTELRVKFQDDRMAFMCICYFTDRYFDEDLYVKRKGEETFDIGQYFRMINVAQYKQKTFYNTLVELIREGRHTIDEIRGTNEERWSKDIAKNKHDVIRIVGYDCFDDENYSERDRKWLFNTMASYLDDDDIVEDAHKVQQIVAMVKTMLQVERIDRRIQQEFANNNVNDPAVFKELTNTKSQYVKIVNSIASENGISEKSGKASKGVSTLSGIMKQMEKDGYDEIKVNIVSSKLSQSYQEVAEINAKALLNELNFTTDDYAHMVATQAEFIANLQGENSRLEEQRRQLTVRVKSLEKQLKAVESDGDGEE